MPSLRYHAGRMVLSEDGDGWRVKIKTKTDKVSYRLSATELEQAVLEAEQLLRRCKGYQQFSATLYELHTLGDSKSQLQCWLP